jgi:hypothetical protein
MEALQEAIRIAEQERDQAVAAKTAAEASAAQALVDLATAQTAAATANAAVLTAAAVTAGQVTFALSPALASNTLLNYRSSEGIKIYGKATSPLDSLFDGDSGALRLFLSKVQQRATQFGWLDSHPADQPRRASPRFHRELRADYYQLHQGSGSCT